MLSKLESYTKKGREEHIYCPSHFNPHSENQSVVTKEKPLILEIEILAGRHLLGLGSRYQGSHNSHFEFCMEIIGIPSDTKKNEKFRFKVSWIFKGSVIDVKHFETITFCRI